MELGLSDNYEAISFNIGYTMQSGRDGSGPTSNDNHPGEVFAFQIQDWSKVINALNSTIHVIFHMRSTFESWKVKTGILT